LKVERSFHAWRRRFSEVELDLHFVGDNDRMLTLLQHGCIDMIIVDLRDQCLAGLNRLRVLQNEPMSAKLPTICLINEEQPAAIKIKLNSVGVDCRAIKFFSTSNYGYSQEIIDKAALLATIDSLAAANSTSQ